jgi:hypothetical protein
MVDSRTQALSGKGLQRFLRNMGKGNLLFQELDIKRHFLIDISRISLLDNLENSITHLVVSHG